jgi:uncharacterized protein
VTSEIVVSDDPAAARYEIAIDGRLAGFVTYRLRPTQAITFLHTEIDPDLERRGYGSRLVRAALDDARMRGLAVRPVCPFVAAFIEEHADEYGDLVVLTWT